MLALCVAYFFWQILFENTLFAIMQLIIVLAQYLLLLSRKMTTQTNIDKFNEHKFQTWQMETKFDLILQHKKNHTKKIFYMK